MTAGRQQATRRRGQRRIIERPRLTRLLDDMDARTILLTAPAGYGKTTLARQWARTLNGLIWIASTPSHCDVVTFSEDVAAGVDALGGAAGRFIRELVRARSNPQRAAREIANALAVRVEETAVQWVVIDDYHELAQSPEVEEMVTILRERISARFLVASRSRPDWVTARQILYGRVGELGPDELAMTPAETRQLLGTRPDLEPLIRRAQGWPAVLTLAAGLDAEARHENPLPTMLYRYVAEELYQSAPLDVQDALITLALLPNLDETTLTGRFGPDADRFVDRAQELGFLTGGEPFELHPLLREFLLSKLAESPGAEPRVREAVHGHLAASAWDGALDLVLRFSLEDLVDPVLEQGFKPLVRSGRLGTLASFAARIRDAPGFPPPAVDVVEAEVALRDGRFELAIELARRVQPHLGPEHPLKSRSNTVLGQANFFAAAFAEAHDAFAIAQSTALDDTDATEALNGLARAIIFREEGDLAPVMRALRRERHRSPNNLLRFAAAELCRRWFEEGLRDPLPIEEPLHALPQVEDPLVRTAFTYAAACSLAQRAEYRRAIDFHRLLAKDVESFSLEFASPYLHWTAALINLGLRRFGEANRSLRILERFAHDTNHPEHALNASLLRARMLLQTGEARSALECLEVQEEAPSPPSWRAEHAASRALVLACIGEADAAEASVDIAERMTRCVEVKVIGAAARAVSAARSGNVRGALALIELAETVATWDPVVCAVRSSRELADMLTANPRSRPRLQRLWYGTMDYALARRAGFRTPSPQSASELLSPREQEVLGLVARGLRNRDIAAALFIAESTAKVHVRHVLEKLGVRSRAEAVARYAELMESQTVATAASGTGASATELDAC
ncbi:MAG TPA: LuxR C-terminal-related transcriptional regulator [Gaiellaceae bacterium]|nr:LuxR C-terminal-related transcriptional regulator [Gaiellaceae bacterium]